MLWNSFILLAVANPVIQVQLIVWLFVMRVLMVVASAVSYWISARSKRPSVMWQDT